MTETWDIRDLSDIRSPAVAAALAYWRGKVTDVAGALPARAAIDPVEMRGFLTKILIVDIARSGTAPENFAFIYRLCGSDITDNNGENLTGRLADEESLGRSAPQWLACYRRTIATRAPLFFRGRMWWQNREFVTFEQINLPLSSDGKAVDKLLCVVDFGAQG